MGQMAYVGPMLGQHHQFHHYNPGKSEWGENRYFKITESIYFHPTHFFRDYNDGIDDADPT